MSISQPVDLLSKQERSIILYLESRLVDQAGLFFGRVFTAEDWKHIARLEKGGLFKVHQIPPAIQSKLPGSNYTHWVDFEDTAWILAHCSSVSTHRMLMRLLHHSPPSRCA